MLRNATYSCRPGAVTCTADDPVMSRTVVEMLLLHNVTHVVVVALLRKFTFSCLNDVVK